MPEPASGMPPNRFPAAPASGCSTISLTRGAEAEPTVGARLGLAPAQLGGSDNLPMVAALPRPADTGPVPPTAAPTAAGAAAAASAASGPIHPSARHDVIRLLPIPMAKYGKPTVL
ncbi:Uncharacterised protein [Mycobacterium tuberculosis]|uniref:Uncharacterized protein n=1 Tax=Mycobacterium tuberculosis TaxID=1773 RepID=A0A655ACE2_MYCTX|nr:Uncharacterised protein [Mycobacterium tuberculosis]